MRVRKALPGDVPVAVALARRLELDYPEMAGDPLWIAVEDGRVVGLVALRSHPDCRELCALGVHPDHRRKGVAKALVEALMAEAPGEVHLATVIPDFFKGCGFRAAADVPATFPARRRTAWCEGCPRERCAILSREGS